ncbi:hypothetical protein FRC12_001606 [Ceratobasidium sp. 428]|nr:hypothetical protein FRC12_001606 [Ceratobasidium sp. 428]
MADPVQSDPGSAPSSGVPEGTSAATTRVFDPAMLKAMRDGVQAKYEGTQEALERNKEKEKAEEGGGGERKGLRAQHMEGIVKHHDD